MIREFDLRGYFPVSFPENDLGLVCDFRVYRYEIASEIGTEIYTINLN